MIAKINFRKDKEQPAMVRGVTPCAPRVMLARIAKKWRGTPRASDGRARHSVRAVANNPKGIASLSPGLRGTSYPG